MSRYYRAPMGDDAHTAVHHDDDLLEPAFVKDAPSSPKRPVSPPGKPIISQPTRPTTATSSTGPIVSPPPPVQHHMPVRPPTPKSHQRPPHPAASAESSGSPGLTKHLVLAGVVVLGLGALVFLVGPSHRAPREYR